MIESSVVKNCYLPQNLKGGIIMSKVKAARKKVSLMKAKMNAAEKRMKAAKKNGSEKQYLRCEKQFKTWKNRYLRAIVELKKAKEEVPGLKQRIKETPLKKIASWTGLAVTVVVTGIVAAIILDKSSDESDEPAADTV